MSASENSNPSSPARPIAMSFKNLNLFRQFYLKYPQISPVVSAKLKHMGLTLSQNIIPHTEKVLLSENLNVEILQTPSAELKDKTMHIVQEKLISRLSFSHFSLLNFSRQHCSMIKNSCFNK